MVGSEKISPRAISRNGRSLTDFLNDSSKQEPDFMSNRSEAEDSMFGKFIKSRQVVAELRLDELPSSHNDYDYEDNDKHSGNHRWGEASRSRHKGSRRSTSPRSKQRSGNKAKSPPSSRRHSSSSPRDSISPNPAQSKSPTSHNNSNSGRKSSSRGFGLLRSKTSSKESSSLKSKDRTRRRLSNHKQTTTKEPKDPIRRMRSSCPDLRFSETKKRRSSNSGDHNSSSQLNATFHGYADYSSNSYKKKKYGPFFMKRQNSASDDRRRKGFTWKDILNDTPNVHEEERLQLVHGVEDDDDYHDDSPDEDDDIDDDPGQMDNDYNLAILQRRHSLPYIFDSASAPRNDRFSSSFTNNAVWTNTTDNQGGYKDRMIGRSDSGDVSILSDQDINVDDHQAIASAAATASTINIEASEHDEIIDDEREVGSGDPSNDRTKTPTTKKRTNTNVNSNINSTPDLDDGSIHPEDDDILDDDDDGDPGGAGDVEKSLPLDQDPPVVNGNSRKPRQNYNMAPPMNIYSKGNPPAIRRPKSCSGSLSQSDHGPSYKVSGNPAGVISSNRRSVGDDLRLHRKPSGLERNAMRSSRAGRHIPDVVPATPVRGCSSYVRSPTTSSSLTSTPQSNSVHSSVRQHQQQSPRSLQRQPSNPELPRRKSSKPLQLHVEEHNNRSKMSLRHDAEEDDNEDEHTLGASTITTNFSTTQRTCGDNTVSTRSLFKESAHMDHSENLRMPQRKRADSDSEDFSAMRPHEEEQKESEHQQQQEVEGEEEREERRRQQRRGKQRRQSLPSSSLSSQHPPKEIGSDRDNFTSIEDSFSRSGSRRSSFLASQICDERARYDVSSSGDISSEYHRWGGGTSTGNNNRTSNIDAAGLGASSSSLFRSYLNNSMNGTSMSLVGHKEENSDNESGMPESMDYAGTGGLDSSSPSRTPPPSSEKTSQIKAKRRRSKLGGLFTRRSSLKGAFALSDDEEEKK